MSIDQHAEPFRSWLFCNGLYDKMRKMPSPDIEDLYACLRVADILLLRGNRQLAAAIVDGIYPLFADLFDVKTEPYERSNVVLLKNIGY